MGFWNDSDIEAMLAGAGGVAVVHGTETGNGIVDRPTLEDLRGSETKQQLQMIKLMVRTSAFPSLGVDEAITVGGVAHTVSSTPVRQGDGALTEVFCEPT